jgi:hypothetical protein
VTVSSGLVGASVAGSIATAIAVRAGLGPLGSDRLGRNLRDAIVNSHVDVDLALALDAAHGHLRVTIAPGPPLISALQAAFGADRVAEAGDAAEIVIERPGLRVAT